LSQVNDQMPVPRRNAAMEPALDGLPIQPKRIGHHGATAEGSKNCSVVVLAHSSQSGCNLRAEQELNCAIPPETKCPHTRRVSKKARPISTRAITEQVGERIQWARELIEPNRSAFARIAGIDRGLLRAIETGRRVPSIFAVISLAHRMRVSTDYILTGSMRGVDGELALKLIELHPELAASSSQAAGRSADTPGTGGGPSIPTLPRRPSQSPLRA